MQGPWVGNGQMGPMEARSREQEQVGELDRGESLQAPRV